MVVVPMNATILESSTPGGTPKLIDRSTFLVVPGATNWSAKPVSPVVRVVCLLMNEAVRALTSADYRENIEPAVLDRMFSTPRMLTRNRWFDELVYRYQFERVACRKRDNAATRFLEVELTKELFFACVRADDERAKTQSVLHGGDRLVERAVAYIEERLFDSLEAGDIAAGVGASESTLLRKFKSELGQGPSQYVRSRRLDESLLLVRGGAHSISEIATKVGYQNVAAFTSAFRKRFGRAPSAEKGKTSSSA